MIPFISSTDHHIPIKCNTLHRYTVSLKLAAIKHMYVYVPRIIKESVYKINHRFDSAIHTQISLIEATALYGLIVIHLYPKTKIL